MTQRPSTVDVAELAPRSTSEIDVVEEVARHYGYENVPKRVPLSPLHGHLSAVQQRRRQVRQVLLGLGISEVMPSPFLSVDELRRAGFEGEVLRITNPLVADEDVLRPSLRAGSAARRRVQRGPPPPGRGAVRDRSRVPAGPRRAPRRTGDARRRPRRRRGPGSDRRVARAGGGARRRGADRPAARPGGAPSDAFGDAGRRPSGDRRRRGDRP